MPAAGQVFVTPHAVRQFIERIAPMAYEQALGAIIRELDEHCVSVKPSCSGKAAIARTRGGRYDFRAVIGPGQGPLPAVITILKGGH